MSLSLIHISRETVTDRAGLTGDAATGNGADDVVFAHGVRRLKRLIDDQLQRVEAEVVVDVSAVDGDGAAAREDSNSGHRAFSSAGAVKISFLVIHLLVSSLT